MIVCIGDSITYGQHLSGSEKAWPALIYGHRISAAGVPSDTTRLGLERFPQDVQTKAAKAVIIQFGHNDANRWETDRGLPRVSPEAYTANLKEMVARCRVFKALPLLCTITPSLRSKEHARDAGMYDGYLRRVAEMDEVEIIDVRTYFEEWGNELDSLLLEDGLHLSPMGHHIYAVAVQRTLDAHWPR